MDDEFAIPAATVQDLDLSDVEPRLASEIRRLGGLMDRGEEMGEQFVQLVRLVLRAGFTAKAECLLRRGMEGTADDLALYRELFGTEKPDEFAAAIAAFAEQFAVGLEPLRSWGFLDSAYRTEPQLARFDELRLLNEPCEVRFDYADEVPAADVWGMEKQESLLFYWINGVWEITGPSPV
jgi:hypothetical protein